MSAENILNSEDLAAVRDAGNQAHAACVAKVESDVDYAIIIGIIPRKDRASEIRKMHMRRLDALLTLLDKANSIK